MSLPPDGRKPVSFKFLPSALAQKEEASAADSKDSKTRLRLARPNQHNVFESPRPSSPQALATRTATVVSTGSGQSHVHLSTSSSSSTGAVQHPTSDAEHISTSASSPSRPSDKKATSPDANNDSGTLVSDADAIAIIQLSPLREPIPYGFKRYELSRSGSSNFVESIYVCIPQGMPDDPRIEKEDAQHILLGNDVDMGHLGSVTGKTPKKKVNTPFPKHWNADKILLITWQIAKVHIGSLKPHQLNPQERMKFVDSIEGLAIKVVVKNNSILTSHPLDSREVQLLEARYDEAQVPRAEAPAFAPKFAMASISKSSISKK